MIEQQTRPLLPEGVELDKPEINYEIIKSTYYDVFDTVRISWTPKIYGNSGSYFFVKYT